MPTRRAGSSVVPLMEENGLATGANLKFNEPLTWKAGKQIPVSDLLRRLRTLKDELEAAEQEEYDPAGLKKVAQDLCGPSLLSHRDGGVRALAACCIVEMLRVCAPNAPYTPSQLKTVFTSIIQNVFPYLGDSSHSYHRENLYVLKSLAQTKSSVLVVDVPSSDSLINALFTVSFDIAINSSKQGSAKNVSSTILQYLTEILITIVDEAGSLPSELVEVIVAQFLRYDTAQEERSLEKSQDNDSKTTQTDLLWLREVPPAYTMAKAICDSCPDKMSRYVSQYFNEVILDVSSENSLNVSTKSRGKDKDDDDDGAAFDRSSEGFKDLAKAHKLIQEIWRACPEILQNVIPQLEVELNTENVHLRVLATQTLGEMLSGVVRAQNSEAVLHPPSAYPPFSLIESVEERNVTLSAASAHFTQAYPSAYTSFLGRQQDKSPLVRAAWTTSIGRILLTADTDTLLHNEDKKTLVDQFSERFLDPDERVRLAAVKAVGLFSTRELIDRLHTFGGVNKTGSVLFNLVAMIKNNRPLVRAEAIRLLARFWGVAAGEIAVKNDILYEQLSPIPSKLMEAVYVNEPDINTLIDTIIHESLLPMTYPKFKQKLTQEKKGKQTGVENADELRVERLLVFLRDLEPKAKRAFFQGIKNQVQWIGVLNSFLDLAEKYNGGTLPASEAKPTKQRIAGIIGWVSKQFPDSPKIDADLWRFVDKNDRRTYQLFKYCMNSESDHLTVLKAIKEIRKRIESGSSLPPQILDTINNLLHKVSLLICNKSHIPAIMKFSQDEGNELSPFAQELLKEISSANPAIFKARVKELCRVIQNEAPSSKRPNDIGVLDALKACQTFSRKFPNEMPDDSQFRKALMDYTQWGKPEKAAKYAAAILLTQTSRAEEIPRDILKQSCSGFKYGAPDSLAKLAAAAQAITSAPEIADEFSNEISTIAIQTILLQNRDPQDSPDPVWVDDEDLDDECKAKILALKMLANRLLSETEKSKEESDGVLKLLYAIVRNEGELSKDNDTPASHRSRLVLTASQLLLKLNTKPTFSKVHQAQQFNALSLVAQDTLYRVRLGFIEKLKKYLAAQKLPAKYYAIAFLTAFEPQQDFKDNTTTWLKSRAAYFTHQKSIMMEYAFVYLISLLAHHPDFGQTTADLADFAKYLVFYLQVVATDENLSFIFYLSQRIKQSEDALDKKVSENLYYLSDLAQAVIKKYEAVQGWTMHTWPGTKNLPASIYSSLPSHAAAQAIANKKYLPDDLDELLEKIVHSKTKARKRKSDPRSDLTGTKKQKVSTGSTAKRSISSSSNTRKTKKKAKGFKSKSASIGDTRRSGRVSRGPSKSYAEKSGDEDDEEGNDNAHSEDESTNSDANDDGENDMSE